MVFVLKAAYSILLEWVPVFGKCHQEWTKMTLGPFLIFEW